MAAAEGRAVARPAAGYARFVPGEKETKVLHMFPRLLLMPYMRGSVFLFLRLLLMRLGFV